MEKPTRNNITDKPTALMNAEKKAQEKKTMQDGDDGTTKTKTDYTKHKKAQGQ